MRNLLRHRFIIGTTLVAGALLAVALWPERIGVDVATVIRGPMEVTVDHEGVTRVRHRFVVSAPVAGRVDRINLEPGDRVTRGRTTLARIVAAPGPLLDPRTQAELASAAAAVEAAWGQARAEQNQATVTLTRARTAAAQQEQLGAAGLVSPDSVEAARAAVRHAEEVLQSATFALARQSAERDAARMRLSAPTAGRAPVVILSPIDGVVLSRRRESQAVVPAGEPLVDLGVLDGPGDLEVVADVLSTDAVRVSPGQAVRLEQWGGGAPIAARVRRVEPSGFTKISALGVEEQRVNVVIAPDASGEWRRLGDGYRVEARIVVWNAAAAIQVPVGSLFRRGDAWAVFVVVDGRAEVRPVTLGEQNGVAAEVLDGLSAGDAVVVYPPDTLAAGARVTVRPRG